MALPAIMRRLFAGDGYGPLLKDAIVSKHISIQDWSNAFDYQPATLVRGSDSLLYWSVAQSGPGTGAGAVDPTADNGTYWGSIPMPTPGLGESGDGLATTGWVKTLLAAPVYVDGVNGSDANDGFSAVTAVKTIAKGLDILGGLPNLPGAHSRLVIASGTYNEDVEIATLYCNISIDGNVTINGSFVVDRSFVSVSQVSSGNLIISTSSHNTLTVYNQSFVSFDCSINITSSNSSSAIHVANNSVALFNGSGNTIDIDATDASGGAIFGESNSLIVLNAKIYIHGSSINSALRLSGGSICYVNNEFKTTNATQNGFYITNNSWALISNNSKDVVLYGGFLLYASASSRITVDNVGDMTLTRTRNFEAIYAMWSSAISITSGNIALDLGNYSGKLAFGANENSNISMYSSVNISLTGTCSSVIYARHCSSISVSSAVTFSGTPTGKRYQVSDVSVIDTSGGGANRFPGTTAGTADSATFSVYH